MSNFYISEHMLVMWQLAVDDEAYYFVCEHVHPLFAIKWFLAQPEINLGHILEDNWGIPFSLGPMKAHTTFNYQGDSADTSIFKERLNADHQWSGTVREVVDLCEKSTLICSTAWEP
jgi:hypothetical protein